MEIQNRIKIHLILVDKLFSSHGHCLLPLSLPHPPFDPPCPLPWPYMLIITSLSQHNDASREVGAMVMTASTAVFSWQLHLATHWNHLGLSRFVQILKNSLLSISSDFNEVLFVVNSEVPFPDDLLQGSCILLHPKNCAKGSVENDIGLGSLPRLGKKRKEQQEPTSKHCFSHLFFFFLNLRQELKPSEESSPAFSITMHWWGEVWINSLPPTYLLSMTQQLSVHLSQRLKRVPFSWRPEREVKFRERQAELFPHILICSSTGSIFQEVLELAGGALGAVGTAMNKVPVPLAHTTHIAHRFQRIGFS